MSRITKLKAMAFCAAFLLTVSAPLLKAQSAATLSSDRFTHVLLISVDGLHALDVANYVTNNPRSALAELSRHGITSPARPQTRIPSPAFWPK